MATAGLELLKQWGMAVGIEGTTMFLYEFGIRELKKQSFMVGVVKTLKHYTEPVLAIAISVVSIAVAVARLPEVAMRAVRVIGSYGVYKALNKLTRQEPSVVVTGPDTVEVINLDPDKDVRVWVDESEVALATAQKTDSAGSATIKLPSALTKGTHKVLVATGFKAAFTEQYIE